MTEEKTAESLETVHTHTHTHGLIIEEKNTKALLVVYFLCKNIFKKVEDGLFKKIIRPFVVLKYCYLKL